MECPKCRSENRDGVNFCEECGAKMEMACPNCGAVIPLGKKFCGHCGHKLQPPVSSPSPDYSKPNAYTPRFMAEKILTTRSAIEGERKLVTVLFADVANYTSISERLDPEEVHQIMDGCFKILMDEIHKFEGTINQFTGDGVMALFGAPLAHEDHAQRACYASLAIQKTMADFGEGIKKRHGLDFKMRIGLNSGQVVVGAIGDDLRMDYTAIGDTTNLGSRMESMAKPGTILVSAKTYRLVKDFFALKSLGKAHVKGKAEEQDIYELVETRRVVTRLEASASKGLTEYVGHEPEMEAIQKAFEKTRSGSGQVMGIVGEAGVGKSRLILEYRKNLSDEFIHFEGRCLQFGDTIPFLPLLDILKSYFEIQEGDQGQVVKRKIEEKILELDHDMFNGIPAVQDLLSLQVDDQNWIDLEPRIKRERTFEVMRDLVIRVSEENPLILVIDNLQWVDKTSEEFLDYLIGWLAHTRIFLLLLYRPEYTHPWGSRSYYSQIGLDELSSVKSLELITSILKGIGVTSELRDLILNRTGGNPLFIEELIYTLLENGSIARNNNQYVLSGKRSEIHVPDTIQGIIAARMDRLEDNIKRTMQVASVIGRDFAYSILQIITGLQSELKSYLIRLQDLEFIYEKRLFPELEYFFKHAVTQEVAYDSLLLQRRKALHEKIGHAIEQFHREKLEEYYEILAYHYDRSEDSENAYRFLRLSGDKAMRNNSVWEAYRYYQQAMVVLKRFAPSNEIKKRQLETVHLWLIPTIVLGFPEESLQGLAEGERLSKELGEDRSLTRIYSNMGLYYSIRGRINDGITFTRKAFDAAEKIQDVELMSQSGPDLCLSYMSKGDFVEAIDVGSKVLRLIEKTGTQSETFGGPAKVYPAFLSICGYNWGLLGNFKKAASFCKKGLSVANDLGSPLTIGLCEYYDASVLLLKGELRAAKEHFEMGIKILEEVKFIQPLALAWSGLGTIHCFLGDEETGKKQVEKGLEIALDAGVEWQFSNHHLAHGICYFHSGDTEKALEYIKKANLQAQKNLEKHVEGKTLIWLGRVWGRKDSKTMEKSDEYFDQGVKILDALGTKPDRSMGYLFWGMFYADHGFRDKALEILEKAELCFIEMGAKHWLEETRTVLETLKAQ